MTPAREAAARLVLDLLWRAYRARIPYARAYEELARASGGAFRNDHLAFRTFAAQSPWSGVALVARPFEALGWEPAGVYRFPDKKLRSVHLAPPRPDLPKVFVSELRVWELSAAGRRIALTALRRARAPLPDAALAALASGSRAAARRLAASLSRPWPAPREADALALERESQFGAWVLLHGHSVNHFTAAVDDIESAVERLRAAGVPMKPEIEGERGSRLRQSSTLSAVTRVPMRVGSRTVRKPWTDAYFELAERPLIGGERFEGFLGGQAAALFEMTRRGLSK